MNAFMRGYDFTVEGPVVHIQPGRMVEFAPGSALQKPPRSVKEAFEAAFDTVAERVVEDLLQGTIQLEVTGMDPVWGTYFRDAIVRALKKHNEQDRDVSLV